MDEEAQQEELLYEQLLGAYYAFPAEGSSSTTTENFAHWNSLNNVIDGLEKLGHSNYSQFKISPETAFYNNRNHLRVNIANLRMNMMSALRMIAKEFNFSDPAYLLSQYGASNNINMHQNANPVNTAAATQSQEQSQTSIVSIEQQLTELQRFVDENLTDEQIEQIREPLETFKQNPTIWRNAQKLISIGATFSRDIAVQFLGSVLAILASGK